MESHYRSEKHKEITQGVMSIWTFTFSCSSGGDHKPCLICSLHQSTCFPCTPCTAEGGIERFSYRFIVFRPVFYAPVVPQIALLNCGLKEKLGQLEKVWDSVDTDIVLLDFSEVEVEGGEWRGRSVIFYIGAYNIQKVFCLSIIRNFEGAG